MSLTAIFRILMTLTTLSPSWTVTGLTSVTTTGCTPADAPSNCPPGQYYNLEQAVCADCWRGKYKEEYGPQACDVCPMDERGQQSTTYHRGASNISECSFRPYIKSFNPPYGPVAGGTNITVEVGYLNDRQTAYVRVAAIPPPRTTVGRTKTAVMTMTGTSPDQREGNVIMQMFDAANEYTIQSQQKFKYLPDPVIYSVDDMKTIISGGLVFVVRGEHLKSVYRARLMIRRIYRGNETYFYVDCKRSNSTVMTCVTPSMKKDLDMDTLTRQYEEANRQNTLPQITTTSSSSSPSTTEQVHHDAMDREKRETPEALPVVPMNNDELDFTLGFDLDGVQQHRNISSLPVYPDPDFYRFKDPDNLKTFYYDETSFLDIRGTRLNHGVRIQDIVVKIGRSDCEVTLLAANLLTCKPPSGQPESGPEGTGPRDTPMVIVYVGEFLSFAVGFLEYRSRMPRGYPNNMPATGEKFILIMSATAVVLLWVLVAWGLGAWHACGTHVKPLPNDVKDNDDAVSRESDYRMDSERYLTPLATRGLNHMNHVDEISGTGAYASIPDPQYDEVNEREVSARALLSVVLRDEVRTLCIDHSRLNLGECIGQGNFGCVYKGTLTDADSQNPQEVAVKTLQETHYSEAELWAFIEEAIILKGFQNKNIVQLYGITIDGLKPHVILEYMDKSDLKAHVSDKSITLTKADLLGYGLQVAEGMAYLSHQGFIHRDLAARNCMINSSTEVKIADFGLSRDLHSMDYYRMQGMQDKPMPIKWMSPESLNVGKFSVKSDVWSYGVLLWELLTRGVTPYPDVDNFDVREYVNEGRRLDRPAGMPDDTWLLMMSCWSEDPEERPDFERLVQVISATLEDNYEFLTRNDYIEVLSASS